jgi:hypothetical protein
VAVELVELVAICLVAVVLLLLADLVTVLVALDILGRLLATFTQVVAVVEIIIKHHKQLMDKVVLAVEATAVLDVEILLVLPEVVHLTLAEVEVELV